MIVAAMMVIVGLVCARIASVRGDLVGGADVRAMAMIPVVTVMVVMIVMVVVMMMVVGTAEVRGNDDPEHEHREPRDTARDPRTHDP